MKNNSINVHYNIIGDGEELPKLKFLTHSLKLEDSIIFHGACEPHRVRDILNFTDIYLMASFSEGINNSALEAMSMEIPVLASDVGGMKEVVNPENGILFEKHNYNDFVENVLNLLSDKNKMKRLGRNGRDTVLKNHSILINNEIFFTKYKKLIY